MMRILQYIFSGALLGLAASACGDSSSTAPSTTNACSGDVQLHMTAGPTLDLTWTPTCRLFMVGVELSSSGHDLWFVAADASTAGLTSPIRYGTVPVGAHVVETPDPPALQPGVSVNVLGFRLGGTAGRDTLLAGVLVFTP